MPTPVSTPRVGLVVSKAVGSAVVRNRVKRRLRALLRDRLERLGGGTLLVVRANPASAAATSGELAADLDSALDAVLSSGRRGPRAPRAPRGGTGA